MIDEHAPLAPSAAHIWVECPGSVGLMQLYPEPDDSPESREGTAAHWYVTETLQGRDPGAGAIAPNGVPIDAEMVDSAQGILVDVRDSMRAHPAAILRVEHRVYMPTVHEQNWGTPDVTLVDVAAKWVGLWDYKYGHRYVDPAGNWQLVDYALGVLREFAYVSDWPNWRVSLNIAQPRNYHASGPIREWQTDGLKLLDEYQPQLYEAAAAAMGSEPELRTNENCRDCSARFDCPALHAAGAIAMDVALKAPPVNIPPAAVGLTLRQIDDAITRLDALKTGLEQHALGLIRSGQRVPFFSAEHTTGREKWACPASEILALGEIMGVPGLQKPIDAITPGQARTAFTKAGVDASVIDAYAERPRGALRLVRVDDNAAKLAFD